MAMFELTSDKFRPLQETTLQACGIKERNDLQRLLRAQIDVVLPSTLVFAEEFGEWDESKRRIDLLGLDKDGNLVVIELKRTEDGGHMDLQAIRYAAMVSTMTFDKVVQVYSDYLSRTGQPGDARAIILDFLGWAQPDEERFAQDVKIVLVAQNFSRELTTAVMWLNDRDLDIRCVKLQPYSDGARVFIDVQQVIPLPEAEEYQVQIREKEQRGRQERAERHGLRKKFWQELLRVASGRNRLHANVSAVESGYIAAGSGIRGLTWNYVIHEHESRVELYIDRGSGERDLNKRIFDTLFGSKTEIETAFGSPINWERLDDRQACRVSVSLPGGGYRDDEHQWRQTMESMVDAMTRFESAVGPHVQKLRGSL